MRVVIQHWWVLALRAGLAMGLAIFVFLMSAWAKYSLLDAVTVPFMVAGLSAYGILDSLLLLYLGFQLPHRTGARALGIMQGIGGMILGGLLLSILFAEAQLDWFIYLITAQAGFAGAFELTSGRHFQHHHREEWACYAAGIVSIIFALLLQIVYTGNTRQALDWFIAYALLLGISMAWFGFRLHALGRTIHALAPAHSPIRTKAS